MTRKQKIDYEVIEENDLSICKQKGLAMTSPLLECAGLFIYSSINREGILAHWQDRKIEELLYNALSQLKLKNPNVVIAGCGVPIECPIYNSQTYQEVKEFLNKEGIPIREQKVGLDLPLELKVNFSNGLYRINYLEDYNR